jgi:hypothetical protein
LKRIELWTVAAWSLLVAEVGLLIYYASAGPGAGPVRVFLAAPTVLMGAALLVGLAGAAWSFFHPPFLRGRRVAALCCCAFVFLSAGYPIPFPVHRQDRPSRVEFQLPVAGEWITAWGGDDTTVNLLARSGPDRRYALVLVPVEGEQQPAPAVIAPAAGTVVAIEREPAPPGTAAEVATVVIEVAPEEYLFVSNLAGDTLAVSPGQTLEGGAPLGRIATGSRSRFVPGPHLGLHLQDTPEPYLGQGIPWFLHDVEIDGRRVERGMPSGGGREGGRWTGQRIRRPSAAGN